MINAPEISIVVPVYNAAATIEACVKSVLEQDFTQWELILVDDGSTDESVKICSEIATDDKRIIVLRQEHKGVSAARNLALDTAKGNYICFIDSDDTVEPDYLSSLYEYCNFDMVICGYFVDIYDKNNNLLRTETHNPALISQETIGDKERLIPLFTSGMMHPNWNKLYKKKIIDDNKIRFKPYPINEDNIFILEYIMYAKSIYTIEKPLYHWIRIENSKTGVSSMPDNLLKIYNEAHLLTRKYFGNNKTADNILYYSYNLIVLKYFNARKDKLLPEKVVFDKLNEFHNNSLVKDAYKAYTPESRGEKLTHALQKYGLFKLYYFIHTRLL